MAFSRLLVLLGLVLLTGCSREASRPAAAAPQSIGNLEHLGAPEFKALAERTGGLYLDVRTPGEVARGHLPGASVIDLNDARFAQKVDLLPRGKPVFVYCASGNRSRAAGDFLVRAGFSEVYSLTGGIRAWSSAGLPTELPAGAPAAAILGTSPEDFDRALASEKRVLVDFHAPWCAPCRRMAPVVDAVAAAWAGKVKVLRADVDLSLALAEREKVSGVPVLVLYVDGKERWRKSGETPREVIEAELAKP